MNALKALREELDISQAEMGALLDVSQASVSAYENGKVPPPDVAARVIRVAEEKGKQITFDSIYAQLAGQP